MNLSARRLTPGLSLAHISRAGAVLLLGVLLSYSIVSNRAVAGLLLISPVCFILLLRPAWGLYLLVALIPYQIFPSALFGASYSASVAELLVRVMFLITVFRLLLTRRLRFAYSPLNIWIALFMLAPFLSALNAQDLGKHITSTIPMVVNLFLFYFVVVNNVNTKKDLQRLVGILFGASLFTVLLGTLEFVVGPSVTDTYLRSGVARVVVGPGYAELRTPDMLYWLAAGKFKDINSIFVNHSDYGGFLLYLFPIALGLALLAETLRTRLLLGALALLLGFNIVISLARSAWLGMVAALLVLAIVAMKRSPFLILLLASSGIVLATLGSFVAIDRLDVLPSNVQDRFQVTAAEGLATKPFQDRLIYWENSLDAISRAEFLGTGVIYKTHNQYVEVLLLFGVLGLALHLAIMGHAVQRFVAGFRCNGDWYLRGMSVGGGAALVGLSVHSFFWNDLFYVPANDMLYGFLLSLAALLPRFSKLDVDPKPMPHRAAGAVFPYHLPMAPAIILAIAISFALLVTSVPFAPFAMFSYSAMLVIVVLVLADLPLPRRLGTFRSPCTWPLPVMQGQEARMNSAELQKSYPAAEGASQ